MLTGAVYDLAVHDPKNNYNKDPKDEKDKNKKEKNNRTEYAIDKLNTNIRGNLTVAIDLMGLLGVKYRKTILLFIHRRGQGYGTVLCKSFKHGAKDGQAVDGLQ